MLKNRKEHREAKKKVFLEFLSVNTFSSRNEKPAHSIHAVPNNIYVMI